MRGAEEFSRATIMGSGERNKNDKSGQTPKEASAPTPTPVESEPERSVWPKVAVAVFVLYATNTLGLAGLVAVVTFLVPGAWAGARAFVSGVATHAGPLLTSIMVGDGRGWHARPASSPAAPAANGPDGPETQAAACLQVLTDAKTTVDTLLQLPGAAELHAISAYGSSPAYFAVRIDAASDTTRTAWTPSAASGEWEGTCTVHPRFQHAVVAVLNECRAFYLLNKRSVQ
jgi:hypothetical protein